MFRLILCKEETFSRVKVHSDAILLNHFHVLLDVPVQPVLDDADLLRRVSDLWPNRASLLQNRARYSLSMSLRG
jgi:hypothetical protein